MEFTEPAVMEILLLCLLFLPEVLNKSKWLLPMIHNSSEVLSTFHLPHYSPPWSLHDTWLSCPLLLSTQFPNGFDKPLNCLVFSREREVGLKLLIILSTSFFWNVKKICTSCVYYMYI